CGFRGFGFDGPNRTLEMAGVTMAELAASLSAGELRTRIIDKTGLAGTFDVQLKWTADPVSPPPMGPSAPPADTNGPSLLSAIQEQLGLKLQPAKGPVDVLVIDHLESPSAN
ncbi:MAG TPA: TIGR03435 family protein, partial [Bryobacteraceae bacterium]|nr:TIGR03435 family protein [Bryobacteraceae bacterium]